MSIAIRIEGVGKRYDVNRGGDASTSIREVLGGWLGQRKSWATPGEATSESKAAREEELAREYWALRDVTFDIEEGERVGIIGANGAGKSTLLKILSRVTAPTEGRVEIFGKVGSLLEVGAGFHPELSGRENVFLNGAILGMSNIEIRRKFDQIVHFSGVEKFIDTPVKHYSSGMYVRLAFSVSAWLDPDILIVDEVLAVGDQAFQKKCIERMRELTKEGRTVLFVSHSLATVSQMCRKALYLEAGRMVSFGPVVEATREYNSNVIEQIEADEAERYEQEHADVRGLAGAEGGTIALASGKDMTSGAERRRHWRWHRAEFTLPDPTVEVWSDYPGAVECLGGSISTEEGGIADKLPIHHALHVTSHFNVTGDLGVDLVPSVNLYDENGVFLFAAIADKPIPGKAGKHSVTCILPAFLLNIGRFTANVSLSHFKADRTTYLTTGAGTLRFEIEEADGVDDRRHGHQSPLPGFFRPRLRWQHGVA
ncbi:ABC transporter ATP-binding protein [Bosea sp. 2RAB26]|uniref:ABC transporter ATP-binding protein n=1 Tax=Bosea sp. 2RAB26 TaxID=3237476 RepID=UPI003F8F324E